MDFIMEKVRPWMFVTVVLLCIIALIPFVFLAYKFAFHL